MGKISSIRIFLFLLIILAILIPSCHKDSGIWKPEALLIMKPDSGLTTQIFDFRVDIPNLPSSQQEFFIRWDLNGDSVWDASFTSLPTITHRFYQKGNHTVRVEILTKDGQRLTLDKIVRIDQGYSAPHALFTVDPPVSNYLTEFTFDASSTFDDEDPFSSLLFRWDFESDGAWDTRFNKSGNYSVRLSVTDPTRRVATESKILIVNLHDELIHPDFTWSPLEATVKDTFLLDASSTRHETDPSRVFSYTWDIYSEVIFGPFTDPKFSHMFWNAGNQKVTLIVTDQYGLSNQITKEFYVIKENKPPSPKIFVPSPLGNIATNFFLSAWPSTDDVTMPSQLLVRWDFEGDGVWDTGWSYDKTLFHQFSNPGEYWVTLEAEDEGGERAIAKIRLLVSKYSNPTGYIQDLRDGKYYGTVKIGDQWWMSDNLDYHTNSKMNIPMLQKCYNEAEGMCDLYGSLYQGERSVVYTNSGKNICPDGWRLPTKNDWMELREHVPATGGRDAMMVGGSL
ncbi:MAG: hypothetical protein NTV01_06530, partial [Bacteroidia bacterium]|nr:hypothetical protein [Bacteroidia bacterium]